MTISPEQLAAYADGELDAAAALAVESALADDPALRRQGADHRAQRAGVGVDDRRDFDLTDAVV